MRLQAGDWTYDVTPEDRLWLLRAVEAEGPSQELVARALVNLFAWARTKYNSRRTLGELVQAYATPLMPTRKDSPEGSELRAKRMAHAARVKFARSTVDAVERALRMSWRSNITDYARWDLDASGKGYKPRSAPVRGTNRMWTRDEAWKGYAVVTPNKELLVRASRALAEQMPAGYLDQVNNALRTLDAVGASSEDWDLAAANTLDAVWSSLVEEAKRLGISVKDALVKGGMSALEATQAVAAAAVDTVTKPAQEAIHSLAWPLGIAAVLALVLTLRK